MTVAPARADAPVFDGRSRSRGRSGWSLRPPPDAVISNGIRAGFAGADADRFFDIEDENLAVADAARARSLLDRLDRGFLTVFVYDDFDLHLGQEIHNIFRAPIEFGMAFLAAEALGLGDRDALDPHFLQRFLHLVEFERLNDGFDFLHALLRARA